MNEKLETFYRLRDSSERRTAYLASKISIGLPFQIRALRRHRGWSQQVLADKTGMKQSRVSAMEGPGYKNFTVDTLLRLAAAFDVGLQLRFTTFGEIFDAAASFDPEAFNLPAFEKELLDVELDVVNSAALCVSEQTPQEKAIGVMRSERVAKGGSALSEAYHSGARFPELGSMYSVDGQARSRISAMDALVKMGVM